MQASYALKPPVTATVLRVGIKRTVCISERTLGGREVIVISVRYQYTVFVLLRMCPGQTKNSCVRSVSHVPKAHTTCSKKHNFHIPYPVTQTSFTSWHICSCIYTFFGCAVCAVKLLVQTCIDRPHRTCRVFTEVGYPVVLISKPEKGKLPLC